MRKTTFGLPRWAAIIVLLICTISLSFDTWVDWRTGLLIAGAITLGVYVQEWLDET